MTSVIVGAKNRFICSIFCRFIGLLLFFVWSFWLHTFYSDHPKSQTNPYKNEASIRVSLSLYKWVRNYISFTYINYHKKKKKKTLRGMLAGSKLCYLWYHLLSSSQILLMFVANDDHHPDDGYHDDGYDDDDDDDDVLMIS